MRAATCLTRSASSRSSAAGSGAAQEAGDPTAWILDGARVRHALDLVASHVGQGPLRLTLLSATRTAGYSGIVLNVHSGDVEVLGGGTSAVEVRRTEHLSYDHRSTEKGEQKRHP